MKQSLKDIARAAAIPLEKVQALVDMCGGDEQWIESVLSGATKAEKAAIMSGVAYKAAPDDSGGDEYPPELLDAIEDAYELIGDWQPIILAIQEANRERAAAAAPAPVKARVLTDSGDQSVFSSSSKAAADPWMTWFAGGAPATTKAYDVKTDIWAVALGSDQVTK